MRSAAADIVRDVRLALRALVRIPLFTTTAVVCLGLGIGATTVIFSVVYALLLRPLPYRDADRLVILWNRSPGLNITQDWFSTAQYFDIRTHSGFEDAAIALGANCSLAGDGGEPERLGCVRVSSNLLPMLGASPAAGKFFTADDDVPGRAGKAVLTHAMWQRRYGGDRSVVGRTIRLNDQAYEIAGVADERFALPREVLPTLTVAGENEIFLPLPLSAAARTDRDHEDYNVIARLKPGVSAAAAQAEMDTITARLRRDFPETYPPNGGLTFGVVPLLDQVVGDVKRPLWMLFAAVSLVLAIACANVANLLLSRAIAREKEIALRAALGASRARIVVQLLIESLVLSAAGGAAGLALTTAAVKGIRLLQPANVPRLPAIGVDAATFIFTFVVAIATGLVFGLFPAIGAGRVDLVDSLKIGGGGSTASRRALRGLRLRSLLVAAELSLSVVLLTGAALLVQSFVRLQQISPGFDARGVLTFELMLTGRQYATVDSVRAAYRRLWQDIDAVAGVSASGGVTSLPLSGFFAWGPITIEGRVPPPGERFINADQRTASGRYFQAMGIPLLRGRLFSDDLDTPDKPRAAIVDARMAGEFWPNQDPIGKRFRNGDARSTSPWLTVVGVVGRVKQYAVDSDSRIAFYTPQSQAAGRTLFVAVRTAGDPAALGSEMKRIVQRVDPALPVYRVRTMDSVVQRSLSQQRFTMWLLALFAGTALVLAAAGVYGVMSYLVAQRSRDLGIRMALGATPRAILGEVLSHAARVAGIGAAAGVAAALAAARLLRGLTFGIDPADPATFAGVTVVLTAVALAASYIPARRATKIDPIASLRE
jgi:putative ABC transport system permease protein